MFQKWKQEFPPETTETQILSCTAEDKLNLN